MSATIPPDQQGQWSARRRETRGPTRARRHPLMPPPDQIPAAEPEEDDMSEGQNPSSGGSGGIGGPKAPPAGPSTPPPPNPPSE